jgi:UDP-glucose 4-epimerase
MAILVTGGAGFVAASLIKKLLGSEPVFAVDNLSRGSLDNIADFPQTENFCFRKADLADEADYRAAVTDLTRQEAITEVWHLAANSDIPAGVRDASIDLRDTFMTTFQTLKIMEEFGIRRLFFASSSAIYGDLQDTLLRENTGPLFPISNYGAMKLASEAAISAACERFLEQAVIFRFPNVVGVPATHGVILDFMHRLRQTPEYLQVLGDGTQRKAYLHVQDLVQAMLWIREHVHTKLDVFNIGPEDEGITVRRIAEEVVAAVSPQAELRFGTGNKGWTGDVPRFRYSVAKLQEAGWTSTFDSLTAIRRAVREIAAQVYSPDARENEARAHSLP